jgi:hypothetical protein
MAEVNGKRIAGYLLKRGEKGLMKGFKKRWFIFNGEESDKKVYYYEARDDKKDLGAIQMEHVTGRSLFFREVLFLSYSLFFQKSKNLLVVTLRSLHQLEPISFRR